MVGTPLGSGLCGGCAGKLIRPEAAQDWRKTPRLPHLRLGIREAFHGTRINLHANIPAVLLSAAERIAAAQHISMDELTQVAVRRYLDEMSGIEEQGVNDVFQELRDKDGGGNKSGITAI